MEVCFTLCMNSLFSANKKPADNRRSILNSFKNALQTEHKSPDTENPQLKDRWCILEELAKVFDAVNIIMSLTLWGQCSLTPH